MTAKLTQEEFEKQAREIWGDTLDLSRAVYKNCSHKMWIRCKEHDAWFEQSYDKLVKRKQRGCQECAKRKHKDSIWMIRDTQEGFIAKCVEIYGKDAFNFEKVRYVNAQTKVVLHCNKCHEDFEITPNKLLTRKNGCTNCSKINHGQSQRDIYRGTFEKEIKDVFGDIYTVDMSTYVNRETPVKIFCHRCGNWFKRKPCKMLARKSGCSYCSQKTGFKQHSPSCLYLLVDDLEVPTVVKIGITNNLERRLSLLRSSTPFPIHTLKVFTFEAGCATYQLEQFSHTVFADRNCHFEGFDGCTEWFWYSHEIVDFLEENC